MELWKVYWQSMLVPDWQCPNCTLWNDEARSGCAACAADKPLVDGAAATTDTKNKEQPTVQQVNLEIQVCVAQVFHNIR